MVGPVPDVENFKEKFNDKLDSTVSKMVRAPGYKYPVEIDYFNKITNASHIARVGEKGCEEVVLKVFGCKTCRWVNSDLCPHKGDVTHLKPHANRICSQRLQVPLMLHEEGVRMTGKQMLQVRGYMDADFFSKYVQDKALEGSRDVNDVFGWEKLKADILDKMRKQDEGSKLTVTKNSLDDLRRTITVKPSVEHITVKQVVKEVPKETPMLHMENVDNGDNNE